MCTEYPLLLARKSRWIYKEGKKGSAEEKVAYIPRKSSESSVTWLNIDRVWNNSRILYPVANISAACQTCTESA